MADILLTEQQQAAVDWLVAQIQASVSPVALRGLAGTGKTTVIPALRQALQALELPTTVGSPTHRAAMVLRRKDVVDANTIHAHALTPYFLPEYADAMAWLGADCPRKLLASGGEQPHINGLPWLLHEQLGDDVEAHKALRRLAISYTPQKAIESLGISGRDYLDGFGPKLGEGCLIIDEASMVSAEQLELCQQAFPLVCLVGDPGQLPPVNGQSPLAYVEGFDLTEIHRQAADSPILQLAYAAREGTASWSVLPTHQRGIEKRQTIDAETFLTSPLLVWRNTTRVECTLAIRAALGFPADAVCVGEPLVCRATSKEDRALGFYNNALFRIVEISAQDPRRVTVQAEGDETAQTIVVHLEELHGPRIDPKAVVFRFGYCLTVHTAQGGEWPTVAISTPDLFAYLGVCRRQNRLEEFACWAYTAITRTKDRLVWLTQHAFTRPAQILGSQGAPVQETAMSPRFVAPEESPTPDALPVLDAQDDIPDVPVSAPVAAAIASMASHEVNTPDESINRFMATLEAKMTAWVAEQSVGTMKALDQVCLGVVKCLDSVAVNNDHAQYQLSHSIEKTLEQGIHLVGTPYQVSVQAMAPQGYPVTLTVIKRSAEELVQALAALNTWLQANQYGGLPHD